jgi:transposase
LKQLGRSHREVAASVGISVGTVSDYVARAASAAMTAADVEALSDVEVEQFLFAHLGRNEPAARAAIDLWWAHRELRRTGVTLQLLWMEYRDAAAARGLGERPYGYSQFCEIYGQWRDRQSPVMRQVHRAGEKAFVDYSGKKPSIVDGATGVVTEVELFVMVLGASNYTFVEATRTQRVHDFIGSHVRAFDFIGGVPEVLVPDQLRSAVSGPHRYDPDENPTYAELAKHYGTAIIPARPRKPRDKAKVEVGVLIVQRWVLARLRNQTFFSLAELNARIAELREELNNRRFQKLEGTRRSLFETYDVPALKPLPSRRFEICEWKKARVNIDYHFTYDDRHYSVAHTLTNEPIMVRATAGIVEAFHSGERVASHVRSYGPIGTPVTTQAHRPKNHRDYGAWPPDRMIHWAGAAGPATKRVVESILNSRPHPEQGYRSCMALIRDTKTFGATRTEAACARALAIGSPTRKSVSMILKRGLDQLDVDEEVEPTTAPITHENVRGGTYFDTSDGTTSRRRGNGKGPLH